MSRRFGIGSFRKSAILELLTPDIKAIRDDTQYEEVMMDNNEEEKNSTRVKNLKLRLSARRFYKAVRCFKVRRKRR